MSDYIIALLPPSEIAFLSRGYGRNARGTLRVTADMSASETGDEPLQISINHPDVLVVADGDRKRGLGYISTHFTKVKTVILDDAMQHRKIEAGLTILLTTWDAPYFEDHCLPAGNLRDAPVRARDADIAVVTKCPEMKSPQRLSEIRHALSYLRKPVFFSSLRYGAIVPISKTQKDAQIPEAVLLVTGIAAPEFFVQKAASQFEIKAHYSYRDHYAFTEADLHKFHNFIGKFAAGQVAVLTTEKDAMRLLPFVRHAPFDTLPVFYWKISIDLGEDQKLFDQSILDYVHTTE